MSSHTHSRTPDSSVPMTESSSRFRAAEAYAPTNAAWEFLPFRFERLPAERVLLTNMVGEHLVVAGHEFDLIMQDQLPASSPLVERLRSKHLVRLPGEELPLELLAMKVATRYRRLAESTGLHIFVVSLRCEHSCPYCQVSRQSADRDRYDMSLETAVRALDLVFESPSQHLKIEFQGGEPLLNFQLIEEIVSRAESMNEEYGRYLSFVIATNLALLDDEILDFCDGTRPLLLDVAGRSTRPAQRNRPRPGGDSWERAVDGIRRVRETLGVRPRLGPHDDDQGEPRSSRENHRLLPRAWA